MNISPMYKAFIYINGVKTEVQIDPRTGTLTAAPKWAGHITVRVLQPSPVPFPPIGTAKCMVYLVIDGRLVPINTAEAKDGEQ